MVTVTQVTNDLKSKVGTPIDADGVFGSQCVDTINYVCKTYFNKMLWGNAIDLLNSAKQANYEVEYNEVGNLNSHPKEGWFFVMDTTEIYGHPYGHTGYVLWADAYSMKTLETNVDGNPDSLVVGGPLREVTRNYDGVIGWFRPPYENEKKGEPVSVSNLSTKNVNGDLFSGLTTKVDPNLMNADSNRTDINLIVIHHNAGTNDEGARRTWYKSTGVGTSAHYQVTPTDIWGCVGENFVAYHAGDYAVNQRSIGIEHLNSTGSPSWLIAEDTYKNSAKLIADIARRYNIPIDRKHIVGHKEIVPTGCPGGIDLDKLIRMAKEFANGKEKEANKILEPTTKGGDDNMSFSFTVSDDKYWDKNKTYFYNANTNEVRALGNKDELHYIKQIYKDTTGRDLKHYTWSGKAPVYVRLFNGLNTKMIK